MRRRHFLKILGLSPLALAASRVGATGAAPTAPPERRTLVLLELAGGNDGLNTVVPWADPDYHALRPTLAIPRGEVVALDDELGLHPGLAPLSAAWDASELALVLGLGYADPNRSHFRSIAIWEGGSHSHEVRDDGWVTRALAGRLPEGLAPAALVLGDAEAGPLAGQGVASLVIDSQTAFFETARHLQARPPTGASAALDYYLQVESEVVAAVVSLEHHLRRAPRLSTRFPRHPLGVQLEWAARLLAAGVPLPVIKVTASGFDTHAHQRRAHDRLLGQVAEGLAAFREAMREAGRWDETVVATYSEFGRRAAENASGGTDHGTAAAHLVVGGRVRGGRHGEQPALSSLEDDDLRFTTDYRRLYTTIAERWWGVPSPVEAAAFPALELFGTGV